MTGIMQAIRQTKGFESAKTEARGDRTWGRAHGPSWATSAEVPRTKIVY